MRAEIVGSGEPDRAGARGGPHCHDPAAGHGDSGVVDAPIRRRQSDGGPPGSRLGRAHADPQHPRCPGPVALIAPLCDVTRDDGDAVRVDRRAFRVHRPRAEAERSAPPRRIGVGRRAADEHAHPRPVVRRALSLRRRAIARPDRQQTVGRGGERLPGVPRVRRRDAMRGAEPDRRRGRRRGQHDHGADEGTHHATRHRAHGTGVASAREPGPGAGIGRRRRLKPAGPKGHVGSIPTPGTRDCFRSRSSAPRSSRDPWAATTVLCFALRPGTSRLTVRAWSDSGSTRQPSEPASKPTSSVGSCSWRSWRPTRRVDSRRARCVGSRWSKASPRQGFHWRGWGPRFVAGRSRSISSMNRSSSASQRSAVSRSRSSPRRRARRWISCC